MTEPRPVVAVLADDLIWASRLAAAVDRAGARAVPLRGAAELDLALEAAGADEPVPEEQREPLVGVVVDLNGRRYDGVRAVGQARARGQPVTAVAQHEDIELRRAALAAGAAQFYSYNSFFRHGIAIVERWLGRGRAAAGAGGSATTRR